MRDLFEGLVVYGVGGRIVPGVAESWEISDDGTVYTFRLRSNAKWSNGDAVTAKMIEIYGGRRDKVLSCLRDLGWNYDAPKGTFYLWVPVPKGFTSASFCDHVLETCAVVLAPGAAYGANGEGFVRFSLTVEDNRLDEAVRRMREKLVGLSFD